MGAAWVVILPHFELAGGPAKDASIRTHLVPPVFLPEHRIVAAAHANGRHHHHESHQEARGTRVSKEQNAMISLISLILYFPVTQSIVGANFVRAKCPDHLLLIQPF